MPAVRCVVTKLIADAGYQVAFMSGFAVSAVRLGLPDTGLISFAEMLTACGAVAAPSPAFPSLATAIPATAMRSTCSAPVIEYARAGAAAV